MSEDYRLVWYDKETDTIFLSEFADGLFAALRPINWERFEVLGEF